MLCPLKFSHYEFEGGQECIGSECGVFKRCNVGSAFVAGNAKQATVDANDAPPKGTFQVSHDCGSTFSPPAKIRGEQDSSEKLEADALTLVDNLRMYGGKYAGDAEVEIIALLDRQAAITKAKCEESLASKNLGVLYEPRNDDTREALENDAITYCDHFGCTNQRFNEAKLLALLDRQAAITERECLERAAKSDWLGQHLHAVMAENRELQAKLDELTEQLETAHAKNRSLRQHIAKMQEGRHGWHVKGAELQRQVDELTAENAKLSSDELHLRQALASAEFDNATLREKLGRMLDNAHEITRIGGDC